MSTVEPDEYISSFQAHLNPANLIREFYLGSAFAYHIAVQLYNLENSVCML